MVAWRWFVDGGCQLMWWLVWGSRLLVVGQPQAVLSFGPSAPLHPPRCASLAGTRLRPRVARVLRTTPLTALHIHSFPLLAAPPPCVVCSTGGTASSIVLRTFRSAPSPRCASLAGTRLRPRVRGQGPSTCVRFGTIGIRADGLFQIANTLDYNNRL